MIPNNTIKFFITFFFFTCFIAKSSCIVCYTGTKLTLGQLEETVECPNKRYCYKIVAKSGLLVNLVHAGCGDKRCFLTRNTCQQMNLSNLPVEFCCCDQDRCNTI